MALPSKRNDAVVRRGFVLTRAAFCVNIYIKSVVSGLETRQTRMILCFGCVGCWQDLRKCSENARFLKQREAQNL